MSTTTAEVEVRDRSTSWLRLAFQSVLVTFAILVLFSAWSMFTYGNIRDGLAVLNGVAVSSTHGPVNLGPVYVGESYQARFELKNLTGDAITVLGASTGCGCSVAEGLPLKLLSGQPGSFAIRYQPTRGQLGPQEFTVLLHLNVDAAPTVVSFTAHVWLKESHEHAEAHQVNSRQK